MATESVATTTHPCRDKDQEVRANALHHLAGGAQICLWQIKAIAQMLNDRDEVQAAGFPDEVTGGISAILALASHESDQLSEAL